MNKQMTTIKIESIKKQINKLEKDYEYKILNWERKVKKNNAILIEEDKKRYNEKYNNIRINYWTGLRVRPDNDPAGRNWMTFYCMRYINRRFPEDIMVLINEYLNWIPAGCWNIEKKKISGIYSLMPKNLCCAICSIRYPIYIKNLTFDNYYGICSFQCYELYCRNKLIEIYNNHIYCVQYLKNKKGIKNLYLEQINEYYIHTIYGDVVGYVFEPYKCYFIEKLKIERPKPSKRLEQLKNKLMNLEYKLSINDSDDE